MSDGSASGIGFPQFFRPPNFCKKKVACPLLFLLFGKKCPPAVSPINLLSEENCPQFPIYQLSSIIVGRCSDRRTFGKGCQGFSGWLPFRQKLPVVFFSPIVQLSGKGLPTVFPTDIFNFRNVVRPQFSDRRAIFGGKSCAQFFRSARARSSYIHFRRILLFQLFYVCRTAVGTKCCILVGKLRTPSYDPFFLSASCTQCCCRCCTWCAVGRRRGVE